MAKAKAFEGPRAERWALFDDAAERYGALVQCLPPSHRLRPVAWFKTGEALLGGRRCVSAQRVFERYLGLVVKKTEQRTAAQKALKRAKSCHARDKARLSRAEVALAARDCAGAGRQLRPLAERVRETDALKQRIADRIASLQQCQPPPARDWRVLGTVQAAGFLVEDGASALALFGGLRIDRRFGAIRVGGSIFGAPLQAQLTVQAEHPTGALLSISTRSWVTRLPLGAAALLSTGYAHQFGGGLALQLELYAGLYPMADPGLGLMGSQVGVGYAF